MSMVCDVFEERVMGVWSVGVFDERRVMGE